MMSDADIAAIDAVIERYTSLKVLEWGAGNSTTYFSEEHVNVRHWTAVEHNGHYVDYLVPRVDSERVALIWAQDDAGYIDCVKKNVGHYDLILIDGRDDKREACLAAAMELIAEDGVVLLHDSGRFEYSEWIEQYPHRQKLTEGEVPDQLHPGFFMHRGLTAFYKKI